MVAFVWSRGVGMKRKPPQHNMLRAVSAIVAISGLPGALNTSSADAGSHTASKMCCDSAAPHYGIPAFLSSANGDEGVIQRWIASFTKGSPTDQIGEAKSGTYEFFLGALEFGKHADFEAILRGSCGRFINSQAAFAHSMEGADSDRVACSVASALSRPAMTTEMAEMYWLGLSRDVPFREHRSSPITIRAKKELGGTGRRLFQRLSSGDENGHASRTCSCGLSKRVSRFFEQQYGTPMEEIGYLTAYPEGLQGPNGFPSWLDYVSDATPRYIRQRRDLAEWVHYDFLCEAFLSAALIGGIGFAA